MHAKFPQRDARIAQKLSKLSDLTVFSAKRVLLALIRLLISFRKIMEADVCVFSGFRAGLLGLFLHFLTFGRIRWVYDLVEWKAKISRDNWTGLLSLLTCFVEPLEILMVKKAKAVSAAHLHAAADPATHRRSNGYSPCSCWGLPGPSSCRWDL